MFLETKKEGEAPVKQRPTLRGLIAWLKTKKPSEEYEYFNCEGACLLGQYVNAIGMPWSWSETDGHYGVGFDWWMHEATLDFVEISASVPHTFGAALKRARAAL